jgi:nucleoside-diphosphate-sugar epimerase
MAGKILVAGATGQIGSELTPELRKKFGDDQVVATYHLRKPGASLGSGPVEYMDVTDRGNIENVFEKYTFDAIYLLSTLLSAVGEKDPTLAWNVNLGGLYNILEEARAHGVRRIFWPSSIAVFGDRAPRVNTPSDAVLLPTTMYGVTKVSGELLCKYYHRRFDMDIRCLRYPGIVSSETMPGGGTTDYNVEMYYEAIKRSRYTSFVRADTVLPMMYMPDCIKAAMDVMEVSESRLKWRMGYNVTGMSPSAGELAAEIKKWIPDFEVEYKPDFRQEIADSWPMSLDDSLAREEWGWNATYDLSSMTTDMLARLEKKLKTE